MTILDRLLFLIAGAAIGVLATAFFYSYQDWRRERRDKANLALLRGVIDAQIARLERLHGMEIEPDDAARLN